MILKSPADPIGEILRAPPVHRREVARHQHVIRATRIKSLQLSVQIGYRINLHQTYYTIWVLGLPCRDPPRMRQEVRPYVSNLPRHSTEFRVPPLRGVLSRHSALGLIPHQDSSRSFLIPLPASAILYTPRGRFEHFRHANGLSLERPRIVRVENVLKPSAASGCRSKAVEISFGPFSPTLSVPTYGRFIFFRGPTYTPHIFRVL